MKLIYVIHSKDFDFKRELYEIIRKSKLNELYHFVFPHENSEGFFDSKNFLKKEKPIVIVEASFPKIGVGIEVGWASSHELPIIVMVREGFRLSPSLKFVCSTSFEYSDGDEMVIKLGEELKKIA